MTRTLRIRLLLVLVALGTAGAVWLAAVVQRGAANEAADRTATAQDMLINALHMEAGASTYLLSGNPDDLHLIEEGRAGLRRAAAEAIDRVEGDEEAAAAVRTMLATEDEWRGAAEEQVELRRRGEPVPPAKIEQRHLLIHVFREANATLHSRIVADADRDQTRVTAVLVLIGLLVSLLTGAVGARLLNRQDRRDAARAREDEARRAELEEFAETMQVVDSEDEAHAIVKRHLERAIPAAHVTVLKRNNSENRLQAFPEPAAEDPIAERLTDATPRSCAAARLGRTHEHHPGARRLLECELCGGGDRESLCAPLLVSGSIIGSVLVRGDEPLAAPARSSVSDAVATAAPVLGNLRTLAIAETRAATDALTGLPNRRAAQDVLKRMCAHASRSVEPLAALAVDLDHFKQINDRHGHEKGDEVLAAVGQVLAEALRDSDFAARIGGEEFTVLLAATGRDGALEVAEKLRRAVGEIDLPGLDAPVAASFGVAVFPDDAIEPEALTRRADRALYAAKAAGRDRVEAYQAGEHDLRR